jgi:hypothetical protein
MIKRRYPFGQNVGAMSRLCHPDRSTAKWRDLRFTGNDFRGIISHHQHWPAEIVSPLSCLYLSQPSITSLTPSKKRRQTELLCHRTLLAYRALRAILIEHSYLPERLLSPQTQSRASMPSSRTYSTQIQKYSSIQAQKFVGQGQRAARSDLQKILR